MPGPRPRSRAIELPVLDAWFAIHPDPVRTELGDSLESVIDGDDRTQVTAVGVAPFSWIAALTVHAGDGSTWRGTAWLVSPRVLVTAGHCVFLPDQGGWARSVDVDLGAVGVGERPFPTVTATDLRSVAGWVQDASEDFDYGAVILDAPFDDPPGSFGYVAATDADLLGSVLNIDGYPADKPPFTQWFAGRTAESVDASQLYYDTATYGGQSGAPIFQLSGSTRTAVGIHTHGGLVSNGGTRITPDVAATIAGWVADAA